MLAKVLCILLLAASASAALFPPLGGRGSLDVGISVSRDRPPLLPPLLGRLTPPPKINPPQPPDLQRIPEVFKNELKRLERLGQDSSAFVNNLLKEMQKGVDNAVRARLPRPTTAATTEASSSPSSEGSTIEASSSPSSEGSTTEASSSPSSEGSTTEATSASTEPSSSTTSAQSPSSIDDDSSSSDSSSSDSSSSDSSSEETTSPSPSTTVRTTTPSTTTTTPSTTTTTPSTTTTNRPPTTRRRRPRDLSDVLANLTADNSFSRVLDVNPLGNLSSVLSKVDFSKVKKPVPKIPPPQPLSQLPVLPGLRENVKYARDTTTQVLGGRTDLQSAVQDATQRALRSPDPVGALTALCYTILHIYYDVAVNSPLFIVGTAVLQDGLMVIGSVIRSVIQIVASNIGSLAG